MLEQLTPFRLCSSQPSRRSSNPLYQRRCRFTPRNNPQPAMVRHFNGVHNMRICYVKEPLYDFRLAETPNYEHAALVRSNTFTGLPMFKYRNIPYKEKAIPRQGLLPIHEPWRQELHALTECVVAPVLKDLDKSEDLSNLIECHPYPICRPITAWKLSEIVNIKNKNVIFPNRERLKTPKFTPVPLMPDDSLHFDDQMSNDFESQVFSLLSQILQCRDVESVKTWLATANDREKASMMTILQTAFESKMKSEATLEDSNDPEMKKDDCEVDSLPVKEEDLAGEEADRLLIHSRQSDRTELSRPRTGASKIRPQTAASFASIAISTPEQKPSSNKIYLRYKTNINTKSVQTDEAISNDFDFNNE